MSIASPELSMEWQAVQGLDLPKTALSPRDSVGFAAALLKIFGRRYANSIRDKIPKLHQPIFDQTHRSFFEIQKRLESGEPGYVPIDCPETKKIIHGYRSSSEGDVDFFSLLKQQSYGILPFPQRMMLYRDLDPGVLAKIETAREKAFRFFKKRLESNQEEEKEERLAESSPGRRNPLSQQEQIAATQLLFGGGALVFGGETVYFSDMLHMWTQACPANAAKREELTSFLRGSKWVEGVPPKTIESFMKFQGTSFPQFLVRCSIDALQKNLGMQFSEAVWSFLEIKFSEERIRSDLAYFTANLPRFYEMNLSTWGRDSASLLLSFQLFLFIIKNYPISEKDALLVLLLHRRSPFDEKNIPGFAGRRWEQLADQEVDREAFSTSWKGMELILSLIAKKEDSFANPRCWDLLLCLWHNRERVAFIEILEKLSQLPRFHFTLNAVLEFCKTNAPHISRKKKDTVHFFLEIYLNLIHFLDRNQIECPNTSSLFFDPPLALDQKTILSLGHCSHSASKFTQEMSVYRLDDPSQYCMMLRNFILHPRSWIFDLLKDFSKIETKPSPAVLWDALGVPFSPFKPEEIPSEQTRRSSMEIAVKLQKAHQFSQSHLFSLYIELLRLIMNNQQAQMEKMSQVVDALNSFCPALQQHDVYFIFRYHPDIDLEELASFVKLQRDWASNQTQLQRFVIDQDVYTSIVEKAERLASIFVKTCPDPSSSERFKASFTNSLLSAFFPPLQPLRDSFRITDISLEEGVRWGNPMWATHTGQLKWILQPDVQRAKIGVYLNWAIYKSRPVLFLSFLNVLQKEAFSAFIPIDIPIEEIKTIRIKDPSSGKIVHVLYNLMEILSPQILRESAEETPPSDAIENETTWIDCYIGVRQTLDHYRDVFERGILKTEHLQKMWRFFQEIKLSYRNLFLAALTGRRRSHFSHQEPDQIAAMGHIFHSHPRGALLPQTLLEVHPHKEFYLPDASLEELETYRVLFGKRTQAAQPFPLDLKISGKQGGGVAYRVQSAEELTEDPESSGDRMRRSTQNDVAPPLEQIQGTYVTLSAGNVKIPLRYPPEALTNPRIFQTYFDYHNLMLKASCAYLQS